MMSPANGNTAAGLVNGALEIPPISGEFENRCVNAALAAYAASKMRVEREGVEFVPLPAIQYVTGLSRLANVDPEPLFEWAGLGETKVKPETTGAWGKLLQTLGLNLNDALLLARISMAEQCGHGPIPMYLARRGWHGVEDTKQVCETTIAEIETTYGPEEHVTLNQVLDGITASYKR